MAVAPALPLARAVLEIDARENAAVEAEGMALVHDEVVEVRLQPARRPALLHDPSARLVRDGETEHAVLAASPEPLPIRRSPPAITAGCTMLSPAHSCFQSTVPSDGATPISARSVHEHDLRDAVDRRQVRRAVTAAGLRAEPARLAGGEHRRRRASRPWRR